MADKPLLRTRNIVLGLTLAIALLVGWVILRAVTARPGPLVDYHQKMYELSAAAQPPGPDQWQTFGGALDAATATLSDAGKPPMDVIYTSPEAYGESWAEDHALALEAMRQIRDEGIFEHTARLLQVDKAVRPPAEGPVFLTLLPYLGDSRLVARTQMARMRLAWDAGETGEIASAAEEALALGRIVGAQTTLIDHLVGIAIHALVAKEIRRGLVRDPLEDIETLARLDAALQRHALGPLAVALEGERCCQMDAIQRLYTDDGDGDGRLILSRLDDIASWGAGSPVPSGLADASIINVASALFPSRRETVAQLDAYFDPVIAESQLARHARPRPGFDTDAYIMSLPRRQILLRILIPAIGSSLEGRDALDTELAGTRLMLRLEMYRLRTGAAPRTLAELAAADPGASIIDPMTGEPFLYTPLIDDPAGRPYLLYSAGANGRDDGAAEHPKGEHQALRDPQTAADFVLNPAPAEDLARDSMFR
ncbi:MAG: hypothetical protein ACF8R7_02715 [Phycisphaerales bacterium JB039]